jgi:hypothetical protein
MKEEKLYCPHCGSTHLSANNKGFGAGKAAVGALLTGGVGLLAGFIGSGNVKVTCLKCGMKWNPGQLRTTPLSRKEVEHNEKVHTTITIVVSVIIVILFFYLIS